MPGEPWTWDRGPPGHLRGPVGAERAESDLSAVLRSSVTWGWARDAGTPPGGAHEPPANIGAPPPSQNVRNWTLWRSLQPSFIPPSGSMNPVPLTAARWREGPRAQPQRAERQGSLFPASWSSAPMEGTRVSGTPRSPASPGENQSGGAGPWETEACVAGTRPIRGLLGCEGLWAGGCPPRLLCPAGNALKASSSRGGCPQTMGGAPRGLEAPPRRAHHLG